jgi:hypothetical protein
MLLSPAYSVELFLFSKGGVDFDNKTVTGLFMEHGKQIYRTVPIPPLIDNSQAFPGTFTQRLKKHSRLVQPFVKPGKMKTYETLKADGRYADLLIPTMEVSDFAEVNAALDAYGDKIIVKSVGGSGGENVFAIARKAGRVYEIREGHNTKRFAELQAVFKIDHTLATRKFIAQPFIRSQTIFGEPCDLRLHCRRGKGGKFFVDILPRIGSKKGIISNIHGGGYCIRSDIFFAREFGSDWKERRNKLLAFGEEFANYYQKLFSKNISSNIGIDIGYQNEGGEIKYYIFEVNAYIGGDYLIPRTADIINQLEYYRYLWDKHNLGESRL